MVQPIRLGFSPCPNDCFIFDALVNKKIDTEGIDFEFVISDVEDLNNRAFRGTLDVTKLSFYAFAHLLDSYALLDSGCALGQGCGPLVISKQEMKDFKHLAPGLTIAIPGKFTTAHFLFNLAFPKVSSKKELVFSEIENAVLTELVDAGVIIHENRFTYQKKGLHKVIDLGAFWEDLTQLPIPLGGIAIKKSLTSTMKQSINRILTRSVQFAFENRPSSVDFVKKHAQEMDDEVIQQHIGLYVNDYSLDLGVEGKRAIRVLIEKAMSLGLIPVSNNGLFWNENSNFAQ